MFLLLIKTGKLHKQLFGITFEELSCHPAVLNTNYVALLQISSYLGWKPLDVLSLCTPVVSRGRTATGSGSSVQQSSAYQHSGREGRGGGGGLPSTVCSPARTMSWWQPLLQLPCWASGIQLQEREDTNIFTPGFKEETLFVSHFKILSSFQLSAPEGLLAPHPAQEQKGGRIKK